MNIVLNIRINRIKSVFKVAAEKPAIAHVISEQLTTSWFEICRFKFWIESVCISAPEQLTGPGRICFSIPTCHIA